MYGKIMNQYKIENCSECDKFKDDESEGLVKAVDEESTEEIQVNEFDQTLEITPEQLQELLEESQLDVNVNIGELLETEMVTNRTLYLNDDITLDTISHIIMLIHKYNRDDYGLNQDEKMPIILYLDSGGGEILRGLSLVSAIESSETPVIGVLQGTCMSMCLIIWLACHVRYASRFSNVLYHTLRAGSDVETLIEMENKIKYYKSLQNKLDDFILDKTEIPKKKLKKKRKSNLDWMISLDEMTKYKMYDYLID